MINLVKCNVMLCYYLHVMQHKAMHYKFHKYTSTYEIIILTNSLILMAQFPG